MAARVQTEDFDVGREATALRAANPAVGAVAIFVGTVRDMNQVGEENAPINSMVLEHYPGMTERSLEEILDEARRRWRVIDGLIIHRIGALVPGDQIVMVGITSAHRGDAFAACEFVMDYLKTRAPFWKKEITPAGARWVEGRGEDEEAAKRWRV
jgi:molybdopterin synthase catalytic subunit